MLGVLLMNTGTPDEPTIPAVRAYLQEFLMDPAIIAAPYPIRKVLVNRICKKRPQHTVANYQAFWTPEGSPFLLASQRQAAALQLELETRTGEAVQVALGMRYGNPGIRAALDQLQSAGCTRVVCLPCYPQQVNVCAGTCLKEAHAQLNARSQKGWSPAVFDVHSFCAQPAYQEALAASVRNVWTYTPGAKLLVSFHSTLLADIENGDPYRDQAEATCAALASALGVPPEDALVVYQSRFDNRKWLQPFIKPTLQALVAAGVKDLCVVCPIFTAENTETALEINRDLRQTFEKAASEGARFTYVPSLDDAPGLISALADEVQQVLAGPAIR